MNKRSPFLPLLLLMAFSLPSTPLLASDRVNECAANRDTSVAYLRCLDRQLSALDRDMTLWNNNKIFALEKIAKNTGRKDVLHLFKKAQKSFIKYREHNCRWQYLQLIPDTTAGAIRYKECMVEMAEVRVTELKQLGP